MAQVDDASFLDDEDLCEFAEELFSSGEGMPTEDHASDSSDEEMVVAVPARTHPMFMDPAGFAKPVQAPTSAFVVPVVSVNGPEGILPNRGQPTLPTNSCQLFQPKV